MSAMGRKRTLPNRKPCRASHERNDNETAPYGYVPRVILDVLNLSSAE